MHTAQIAHKLHQIRSRPDEPSSPTRRLQPGLTRHDSSVEGIGSSAPTRMIAIVVTSTRLTHGPMVDFGYGPAADSHTHSLSLTLSLSLSLALSRSLSLSSSLSLYPSLSLALSLSRSLPPSLSLFNNSLLWLRSCSGRHDSAVAESCRAVVRPIQMHFGLLAGTEYRGLYFVVVSGTSGGALAGVTTISCLWFSGVHWPFQSAIPALIIGRRTAGIMLLVRVGLMTRTVTSVPLYFDSRT